MLRIAVVGAGRIGRRHAGLIAASARADLAAIVDPDPQAAALAEDLHAPWTEDLNRLLDRHPPDGVIVATPNALHVEHAMSCLAAGVPVLVEKPMATTVADGQRVAAEGERSGVAMLVGHHRRHSPFMRAARDVIAGGGIGRVVAVSSTTMFPKPADYFASAPWRQQPGGGPILINLIHDVDALRMLVGDVAEVHALASNPVRGGDVEESVAVALRFSGGAVGTMILSDTAASPVSWEMTSGDDAVYPQYPDRDCYLVAGTNGSIGVPTLRLTVADGPPSWHEPMRTTRLAAAAADPLERQLDHFLDVIEGTSAPVCSARDGVESLRVTLAVAEAAATGSRVECGPSLGVEQWLS